MGLVAVLLGLALRFGNAPDPGHTAYQDLVTVYCLDQDKARDFYVNVLGFQPHTDLATGEGFRWVTVTHPNQPELEVTLMTPGPPLDDENDYELPVWAGVLPLEIRSRSPIPDNRLSQDVTVPDYVRRYDARQLLLTGYGAVLSYLSDAHLITSLLGADPLSPAMLAKRREHVIDVLRNALEP